MASVLLLTGAPGAGKSETLTRVHDVLGDAGVDCVAIDVDELGRSYPPIDHQRQRRHLSSLCASYREAGHHLQLIAVAAESDDDLRAWLDAVGADRRLVVHLVAEPATLERRIRERERADWSGLPELIEAARRLAPLRFAQTDLEIDTDRLSPNEVAEAIVTESRFICHS